MGIYVFTWEVLRKYLVEDEADRESQNDFGKTLSRRCCLTDKNDRLRIQRLLERRRYDFKFVGSEYGYSEPRKRA